MNSLSHSRRLAQALTARMLFAPVTTQAQLFNASQKMAMNQQSQIFMFNLQRQAFSGCNDKSHNHDHDHDHDDKQSHSDFQAKKKSNFNDATIQAHIQELVTKNDIVLFMKGNKKMPRCGFSNYVI